MRTRWPPSAEPLTSEQVNRYADLVASGKANLPDGLAPAQQRDLIAKVRDRMRRRLVSFLARQIARDILLALEEQGKE